MELKISIPFIWLSELLRRSDKASHLPRHPLRHLVSSECSVIFSCYSQIFAIVAPAQGTPTPQAQRPNLPGFPPGAQNLDQLFDNPLVQNMLSNPDLLRTMVSSNPQIQNLMERHPELSHALNNPDVMRQAMQGWPSLRQYGSCCLCYMSFPST